MFHAHILLATPLCTSDMTKPGTGKHESGIVVRESLYHSGTVTNLSAKVFDDVVGADALPVFIGKSMYASISAIPSSTFLAASGSLISRRAATTSRAFAWTAALLSCA